MFDAQKLSAGRWCVWNKLRKTVCEEIARLPYDLHVQALSLAIASRRWICTVTLATGSYNLQKKAIMIALDDILQHLQMMNETTTIIATASMSQQFLPRLCW